MLFEKLLVTLRSTLLNDLNLAAIFCKQPVLFKIKNMKQLQVMSFQKQGSLSIKINRNN